MTKREERRNWGLWALLALTLATTVWVSLASGEEAAVDLVATAQSRRVAPTVVAMRATPKSSAPAFQPRSLIEGAPENLFAGAAPHVEERQMEVQPSKPTVPPLPFSYAGKLVEGDATIVFLTHGERNLAVREGETVDGTWRIESIAPRAMRISYLPLNTVVTLAIGEVN